MINTCQTHHSIVRQTVRNRVALVAPGTWLTTACARTNAVLILSFALSLMSSGKLLKKYPLPHITQSLSCAVQSNPLIPCGQRVTFRLSTLVSNMKKSGNRLRCLCSVQREELTFRTILQRTWSTGKPAGNYEVSPDQMLYFRQKKRSVQSLRH